jgi:hypothetical protein
MCSSEAERNVAAVKTIHRGNAAEAAVLAALARADIPVLLPFGGGLAFDLAAVIPPDERIIRIQVKSGRVRNGCVEFNSCSTDHGSGRQVYVGKAEVIAVHVHESERLFVVPVESCPTSKGYLRLDPPKNQQRRRIRLAADYEFDRWVRALCLGSG